MDFVISYCSRIAVRTRHARHLRLLGLRVSFFVCVNACWECIRDHKSPLQVGSSDGSAAETTRVYWA